MAAYVSFQAHRGVFVHSRNVASRWFRVARVAACARVGRCGRLSLLEARAVKRPGRDNDYAILSAILLVIVAATYVVLALNKIRASYQRRARCVRAWRTCLLQRGRYERLEALERRHRQRGLSQQRSRSVSPLLTSRSRTSLDPSG
jgi:hypothetical protein